MTKLLNIDSVRPKIDRELILDGVKYKVAIVDVELFFDIVKLQEEMAEQKSASAQVEIMIDFILKFIPGLTRETLMKTRIDQLQLITDFIRDEVPDEMLENSEAKTETEATKEEVEGSK